MEGAKQDTVFEIAIIGGGPAGLSAALNARSRNKSAVIFESEMLCQKIKTAPIVNNYLGFPEITGEELAQQYIMHAQKSNVKIINAKITKVFPTGDGFVLQANQNFYEAKTVIITIGIVNEAKIKGEDIFVGKGISYCATCDGFFFKGKNVAVISDHPRGEKEANFLAEICNAVYYVPQYSKVGQLNENITVIEKKPLQIAGEDFARQLVFADDVLAIDGIFIERRATPAPDLVENIELVDGHIVVNANMATSIPGLFAAGDCVGRPYQIAKAVGEGLIAALSAAKFLDTKAK